MTIKTLLLTLSLLAAPSLMQTVHAEAAVPDSVQQQSRSQSVTLDMQNMTCAMCKFTIKSPARCRGCAKSECRCRCKNGRCDVRSTENQYRRFDKGYDERRLPGDCSPAEII